MLAPAPYSFMNCHWLSSSSYSYFTLSRTPGQSIKIYSDWRGTPLAFSSTMSWKTMLVTFSGLEYVSFVSTPSLSQSCVVHVLCIGYWFSSCCWRRELFPFFVKVQSVAAPAYSFYRKSDQDLATFGDQMVEKSSYFVFWYPRLGIRKEKGCELSLRLPSPCCSFCWVRSGAGIIAVEEQRKDSPCVDLACDWAKDGFV